MSSNTPAIDLKNVTAGYFATPVISDLTLTVTTGERVAIIGPNGAGKSTLFRIITGLIRPTGGTVTLYGQPLLKITAAERARTIAIVSQELESTMPFTAGELVMMGRTAALSRWSPPSREDRRIIAEAMALTETSHLKRRIFQEMSGGERQRVSIAMALAARPRIILLDEPTAHLDMNHRLDTLLLIERLNREQGVTIMMIGHDLNLAAEYFPRMVLLHEGRIVADGSPAQVLTSEILSPVYRCGVTIHPDPATGALRVFPTKL
ncbi:MAG: ABC transporter ATP-binding protein [Lentisphaerae bacterium]|jgi:iron complex transport system ATP-binding protein|nr:ABC transporter ATP-binding protein [Lentisphaerota bacterium]